MAAIWTILKKELKAVFLSPLFYIIIFFVSLILSITFSVAMYNFAQISSNAMMSFGLSSPQQQNIHYMVFLSHLSLVNLIFIFVMPALSMRLLSEEKKNRTFDLLLTSPIQSYEIMIGKFLSLVFVVMAILLVAVMYIFSAKRIFDFSLSTALVAALGIFLVGLVYSAMSLFASSLTENTMLSFFVGIVLNLGVWIIGGLSDVVDTAWLKAILEQTSLNNHLQALIEGVIRTNSLVYFFSIIVLFCFLTERVIESSRWKA